MKSFSASTLLAQALARSSPRRPRGEKKPIPEEQKDQRYYERRKRNNLAAKKSRDQRKMREDAIGMFNGMFFSIIRKINGFKINNLIWNILWSVIFFVYVYNYRKIRYQL